MIWAFLIIPFMLAAAKTAVDPEYLGELRSLGKDEEFAKALGIDVSLVRPSDERSEGSMMNQVSPLGDIMLTPEQEEMTRQGVRFEKYGGSRWPNDEIPYVIQRSDFSREQLVTIQSAIDDFNAKVQNLKLVPAYWQRDYVYVFSGNGCWSYIGRVGNQQALSLQKNGCVSPGTVQHEFIHAAGIMHEQNRSDRDEYVKILPENIPAEWQSQYEKVNPDDFGIQGPYDYYSVMHYPVRAPGTGKPAFEVLKDNIDQGRIGRANSVTNGDVQKLDTLYS